MPNSYKPSLIVAALLASIAVSWADHGVLVPNIGNTSTVVPFLLWQENLTSMRYQQVYAANAFAALLPTEIYLTRIRLLWDENTRMAIFYTTNLQINLSTTSKMPDGLSTNFAENVGLDDMAVFVTNNTSAFDLSALVFTLPKPFVYRPAEGNLLMDVRIETPKRGGTSSTSWTPTMTPLIQYPECMPGRSMPPRRQSPTLWDS